MITRQEGASVSAGFVFSCKMLNLQDLQLKDYAIVEGFVQLAAKGPPDREKPEELDGYQPPDVNQMAHRLRKNDNSGLVPPWEPPPEEEEEVMSDADVDVFSELLDDPDFKDMGPYTDPEVARHYHSHDVELRRVGTGQ